MHFPTLPHVPSSPWSWWHSWPAVACNSSGQCSPSTRPSCGFRPGCVTSAGLTLFIFRSLSGNAKTRNSLSSFRGHEYRKRKLSTLLKGLLGLGEETLAEVGILTKPMERKNPEKEKLDPGDVTGLLGHAPPEASAGLPLDFTVTEASSSQEALGMQSLRLGGRGDRSWHGTVACKPQSFCELSSPSLSFCLCDTRRSG